MCTQTLPLLTVTVVVLVNPPTDLPAMIERVLWRRPDREHGSACALDPTPLVAGCCLFDDEAQLGGVVESVVDFLLRVFGAHATPTLGRGVTVVNTVVQNASTELGATGTGRVLGGVMALLWCSGWD